MAQRPETYRLYSCGRCQWQVRICRHCDHGNLYCAEVRASVRRRESVRRAGERYQRSYRGACQHAARQRTWRARQRQKVTHQGSSLAAITATVALAASAVTTEVDNADSAAVKPQASLYHRLFPALRCSFCRRSLPLFARLGRLRGGP